jgi:hypothetical protein
MIGDEEFGFHDVPPASVTNSQNSGMHRRVPIDPQLIGPGAVAVDGPDSERIDTLSNSQENQVNVVTASAVDDAELVVYASSVSPDERIKMRRKMIAIGIIVLFVIVGITIGVMVAIVSYGGATAPPAAGDCQDVFSCCRRFNSTEAALILTDKEQNYYFELQNLLVNSSVIDDILAMVSCEAENQCLVWTANYQRRNMTEIEANMSLQNDYPAIQDYTLCLTYLQLDGWHWKRNDGWLEGKNPCSWFGLVCTFLSRITQIQLPSNDLNGMLPPELGRMPFLGKYR